MAILRLIEEEALKDRTAEESAPACPPPVAAFLLNEKRNAITKIELRTRARIFSSCRTIIWKPRISKPASALTAPNWLPARPATKWPPS